MKRILLGILMLSSQFAHAAVATDDPLAVLEAAHERVHRFTMENGMIGVIKPDPTAPVVAIQTWFGTGSIHEDEFLGAGLAHYVEHMIFKGTPTRTPGDISREISDVGGRVNAYTTFDRTVFHVVMPSAHWETGLDVLADAVQNATFPEDEWEREQTVILQEMAMNRDDPQRELGRLLWSTAFRVHPHRHPVIGYREVFLQTTREDLLRFFRIHYRPDNMIIAVAGDVDPLAMEAAIRDQFADFERRMRAPIVLPQEPAQVSPRFARQTGPYEVSRAAWGWHSVPFHHPDAAALEVLAAVIGRGESSRLVREIRDRQGLVHRIGAWAYNPKEPGMVGISATFDPEREEEVIAAVHAEIARWQEEPFTTAEIDRARRQVLVGALARLQTARGQVDAIASGEFYAGDPRFTVQYIAELEKVTPDRLHEVLVKYLQPQRQSLALLTPEQDKADLDTDAEADSEPVAAPQRFTLSNGIPVIVREDRRLPLVHVSIANLGGVLAETEEQAGITRFMAELLPRGTQHRDAAEIAATLEDMGASIDAFFGVNSFGLQGMSLSPDWPELFDLMVESLLEPAFSESEIRRQRGLQQADIRSQRERPLTLADEMVREVLYPDHPYRWSPDGHADTVQEIDRDALEQHRRRLLTSGNLAVSVFGNVDAEHVRTALEAALAAVPDGERFELPMDIGERALPADLLRREPRQQAIFLRAFPGVTLDDDHADALDVLQTAMSGLASNLAIEIRDKRGLVYFVGAMNRVGLAPGRFMIFAGTYEEAIPELTELVEAELDRILTEGLSSEELARAQEQRIGDLASLLQDNSSLAQITALNELFGLGYDSEFTKAERIRTVTDEQIRAAAAALFSPDQQVTAIVLPSSGASEPQSE